MNDDLISRSALLEKAEGGTVCWFDIKHAPAVDAETVIKSLPYVKEALEMAKQNLAPVRHGRWIEKPFLLGTSNFCSLCDSFYGMPHGKYNYCPNCGAKMDGGGDE